MNQDRPKCDGCGDDIFDPANYHDIAEDMFDFINDQDQWCDYNSPSICYGMLSAVLTVIFTMAPKKDQAFKLIFECLDHWKDGDTGNA